MKKINTNLSLVYKFNSRDDLANCIERIGENGYFSDYEDFHIYEQGTLVEMVCRDKEYKYPFRRSYNERQEVNDMHTYFIPEDAVVFKEEEPKKLRPFKSMKEFFDETGFNIGEVITIKRFGNNNNTYEEKSIINGFRVFIDEESHRISVIFGSGSRHLEELFQNFKYLKNNKWVPFGIEE